MRKLEKIDIAAIRKADTIVVRHTGDRIATMECIKKPTMSEKKKDPYAQERRYSIKDIPDDLNDSYRAVEVIHVYKWSNGCVETILRSLKVGDEISFTWSIDGRQNDYMRRAGLHGDSLYLIVRRKEKHFTYMLATQVCENNSARMIKTVGAGMLRAA